MRNSLTRIVYATPLVVALLMSGCAAHGLNAQTFSNEASMTSQRTAQATVVSVRRVQLVNETNAKGATAGAVIGGATGSAIGHGAGRLVATAVSAVAGAFIGSEVQKRASGRQSALQITVRGEQRLHTIVQPDDGTDYRRGQSVLVIQGREKSRVSPL